MSEDKKSENFSDQLMTQVSKSLFVEGMILPATIYIKFKSGQYIPVGKKNDKAQFSALHSFHNVTVGVYVKTSDYNSLIKNMTELTSKALQQPGLPKEIKTKFVEGLLSEALNDLQTKEITSTEHLQRVGGFIKDLSLKNPSFKDVSDILESLKPGDSKHCMTVCMVSLLIAEEMQINYAAAHDKLVLGSLIHDVGLKHVPEAIRDKPKHLMTAEELSIYQEHPLLSVEILRGLKDIPSDVLLMISEHHENANGSGYPKKIRDLKISPLGRILSLADYFTDLICPHHIGSKIYTAEEAMDFISNTFGQPFNKGTFSALRNVLNKNHIRIQKKNSEAA